MLTVRHLSLALKHTRLCGPLTFDVAKGDIVTLMGPSGCGKSSLMAWMVGALSSPLTAEGEMWLDDRRIDLLPTAARQVGILFQDALLFDHFSVGQNLLLALPAGVKGASRRDAVLHALEHAGMAGFFSRDPASLSGGQRARIALLRALLAQPRALLLDEPFSRLDADRRADFRQWVFAEVRRRNIPVVQVTHDEQDIPSGGRVLYLTPPS
ncbi:ATP-binding cassette domain-containing protein [Citrobacter rodentium]|uniref:ABC transporter, ATP-binding protein n=2 Tax=Citrobacter rodentium TaxID=67825 RepID=D2TGQ3_CITRI|nr:ATP-binding cassette domain-containing protein [Citrobacter rodentium]KIQ49482.1 sulfate ABC transporter ATP-binding protein [Citrobacter rodentium]QBY27905.1 ATP-binding cassette domain-containing protein [Citrobacter rodentium]UHO30210.1 ATP-binding cassette domain-containing protein [Citrobacter rodentium NBRC 105723 = DSM 16636]CBG88066.1 ABC transporter, ATP-binding protein [Citrobacter rodentium ICC168]HAT8012419.1 sulfate ABC transporter ATP-binding protein [Citrobacter rodentium NBR